MTKFPSIEKLRNVAKTVKHFAQRTGEWEEGNPVLDRELPIPTLNVRGTVKIHGTNAGVCLDMSTDKLTTLSRTREITPEDDNYGFSRFIFDNEDTVRDLFNPFYGSSGKFTIFGEWCGKGIMKNTAVNELDKMFVIFAIHHDPEGDSGYWLDLFSHAYIEDPEARIFNIENFPTFNETVDFSNISDSVDRLEDLTLEVESECPVGKYFGVSGIGEGIVWTVQDPKYKGSRFWFKTKGQKHKVSKTKKVVEIDPEIAQSIQEFVDATVTEQRLEQGVEALRANGKEVSERSTGSYLKWMHSDIMKEESDRLEGTNLEPGDVSKALMRKARNWWFDYLDREV